ncbi:MAG: alpha amylase C-terminal domain-containing protein, partial [Anaerostipes hadrus]
GTPLYEYDNKDTGESEWGSCNFIHSRREVQCFLQSAANYWLEEYHFDGIRMDAVSRLIYWQGDESRGVNDTAIDFLKAFNLGLKQRHPTAMLIAEDSTAYPGVTEPVWKGGLGFDYKWDLGWMHDTLEYFQTGPEYRSRDYHKLTFSMVYFWNERYMLEYCHDEVVHGKATILQKMYGDYEDKFPQARAMYMYMMIHPGKKLNFMGNEFGQIREWSEAQEQDWMILKYPIHDAFHKYMIKLNDIYKKEKAFHYDYHRENFEWLDCHQEERCIYAIGRKTADHMIVGIFNFSDKEQKDYKLTIEGHYTRRTLLHTEWEQYGGTMKKRKENIHLKKKRKDSELTITLPRYSGVLLKLTKKE